MGLGLRLQQVDALEVVGNRQTEGDAACLLGQFLIMRTRLWVRHSLFGIADRLAMFA